MCCPDKLGITYPGDPGTDDYVPIDFSELSEFGLDDYEIDDSDGCDETSKSRPASFFDGFCNETSCILSTKCRFEGNIRQKSKFQWVINRWHSCHVLLYSSSKHGMSQMANDNKIKSKQNKI